MAKRFATVFFIMIGVVVFLLSAYLMVLFLVPGAQIFGLKYITTDTHVVKEGGILSTAPKTITINSSEVPVFVEFAENDQRYRYEYYDNYSGVTKSTIQDPSVDVDYVDGDVVFTINSFESYLFQNNNSNRFFKILIPLSRISVTEYDGKPQNTYGDDDQYGAQYKYKTNLVINSNKSMVFFQTSDKDRTPAFDTLSVKTTGKITYGCHVKAMTYKLETNSSIYVTSSYKDIVNAKNYDLVANSGKVLVSRVVEGDLTAKTKNGNIEFYSCKNLVATTDLGDVKCSVDGREAMVYGTANINTNAGNIKLDRIYDENNESFVKTGSGSVEINMLNDAKIYTHRGSVKINTLRKANIETNTGNIKVETAGSSINVVSKRGKVELGAEGMVLKNPTVKNNLGKVKIVNASGIVKVETISGDVEFVNGSSQNINIVAGGKLNATKLKGRVYVNASESVNLQFDSISNDVTLLLEDSCKSVYIDATNTLRSSINYNLYGSPATIYESTGYSTFSLIKTGTNIVSDRVVQSNANLYISGDNDDYVSKAKIEVYFARSAS